MEIPYKEILLLILTTLTTYLIWRVQYQKEKLKIIENQLSDKKYKMYSELIYIFFDIVLGAKLGQELTNEEILKRIIAIKKDMYLYAPDIVFRQFTEWLLNLNNHENMTHHFNDYYKLITLVRKDMGNTKTTISRDDFMLFYMQNREEYKKFKIENNWN
ncbi:hypothetical protein VB264_00050 [Arcicella aquatica]|uniref:DUF4240 domain-containing protein n=1 Tax=Arcicella aquatica TaxID=217141 RepID=A0ABU5QGG5_9BACT|nr:hypothetical protein [Arcicella aquatica]MEA5256153.1 hypothetical protein [Arcicella aquatica]